MENERDQDSPPEPIEPPEDPEIVEIDRREPPQPPDEQQSPPDRVEDGREIDTKDQRRSLRT